MKQQITAIALSLFMALTATFGFVQTATPDDYKVNSATEQRENQTNKFRGLLDHKDCG